MSRPHGRAQVDPENPRALAVCQRCSFWYNHDDLRWQWDYRGISLQNLRILVCETCYDDPQPQLKPRILPPDPLPVINARVEPFYIDEVDRRATLDGRIRVTIGRGPDFRPGDFNNSDFNTAPTPQKTRVTQGNYTGKWP